MTTITLSLISHTNVGKTTLARTLLRKDIGEVLDQAHVTEVSEAHELVSSGEHRLMLWDTPGLGDSARLVSRLRKEGNPIGWLLHQAWDRHRDRALYSSQEAARNIQADADVVLYLVNASENPDDAGYIPHEMELLGWLGKPVLVLLNQLGDAAVPAAAGDAMSRWKKAMEAWPVVKGMLPLDAFTRCWVEEVVLLQEVEALLPEDRRAVMRTLAAEWQRRSLGVFDESVRHLAQYLMGAGADFEDLRDESAGSNEKRRAMRALATRLDEATGELMSKLIELHGLHGRLQEEARTRLEEDFRMPGEVMSQSAATMWGAAMGGAAGGLVTDIMTGGLSFGAGAIAGAVLGAMGAQGLLKGFQMMAGAELPQVRWSDEFLRDLAQQALLRYLAVAHFGRGRGEWRELGNAARWKAAVDRVMARHTAAIDACVRGARDAAPSSSGCETILREALNEVLGAHYPQAARLLASADVRNKGT